MSTSIAISGKGGVGKTTIAAIIISRLIARKCTPVFAVDADPNTCLNSVLGLKVENTVGRIREEAKKIAKKGLSAGISKQDLLELKIAQCLVESKDFDLIAMGRSEGYGCYCYANNVLKAVITEMASQYPFVVLDNEAGLENLSRRIVQKVDSFIIVTDPSQQGRETVKRLYNLALEMNIEYDQLSIMVNRTRCNVLPNHLGNLKKEINADFIITLPNNEEVAQFNEDGKSLLGLSEKNDIVKGIDGLIDSIGIDI